MTNHEELIILMAEDDEGHAYLVRQNLQDAGVTKATQGGVANVRTRPKSLVFKAFSTIPDSASVRHFGPKSEPLLVVSW